MRTFRDYGTCTIFDNKLNNISHRVKVISSVDETTLGVYLVNYSVADTFGNLTSITRKVVVLDTTKPILTLIGNPIDTIDILESDSLSGFHVIDNYDKNPEVTIYGKVDTAQFGTYEIEYCATDQSGNKTCLKRSVVVTDRIPPQITLEGESTILHEQCNDYTDAGYSITENYPFGLRVDTFSTLPSVNDSLGLFFVTYIATDSFGNTDTATRTVILDDFTPPTIELIGQSKIYIERWAEFEDPGVVVKDFCSNNENITVIKEGNFINSASEGTYFLDYSAEDISGNISKPVRRYIVVGNLDTVGIEEYTLANLEVYPNPTSATLYVKFQNTFKGNISLYNSQLTQIKSFNIRNSANQVEISCESLSAGIYFLMITNKKQSSMVKVVIDH
ncbi:MAG: immunoglobulin-like domain-containing protein [Bacteroidia bacterium]